mmetsp:Transcript_16452/g.35759  ORF Transcript_16452/g.35759 Transcript_16452/m.35759 type:complete len:202 (-) Transcript_16452:400-1005(-)
MHGGVFSQTGESGNLQLILHHARVACVMRGRRPQGMADPPPAQRPPLDPAQLNREIFLEVRVPSCGAIIAHFVAATASTTRSRRGRRAHKQFHLPPSKRCPPAQRDGLSVGRVVMPASQSCRAQQRTHQSLLQSGRGAAVGGMGPGHVQRVRRFRIRDFDAVERIRGRRRRGGESSSIRRRRRKPQKYVLAARLREYLTHV